MNNYLIEIDTETTLANVMAYLEHRGFKDVAIVGDKAGNHHIKGVYKSELVDFLILRDFNKHDFRLAIDNIILKYFTPLPPNTTEILTSTKVTPIKQIYVNKKKRVTTVLFTNGHKQIVKCLPKEKFDVETAIAYCIAHEYLGSHSRLKKYARIAIIQDTKSK